jgi:hypothetical protein
MRVPLAGRRLVLGAGRRQGVGAALVARRAAVHAAHARLHTHTLSYAQVIAAQNSIPLFVLNTFSIIIRKGQSR